MVDEMRGTAEEFCEFAGAPQELLALMRGESIRGGWGLGEGDDWMGHCRLVVERGRDGGAHFMGQFLWAITRPEAKSPSLQTTQKWRATLARFGTD